MPVAPKPNQGMRSPQFGGIGSRLDVGRAVQTCKHDGALWRLTDGTHWVCGVCHPPAVPSRAIWQEAAQQDA